MNTAPCQKCQRPIPRTAEVCPECGYNPQSQGRIMRKIFVLGGLLLTLSIVGAPIGLPMFIFGVLAEWRTSNQTPTDN